MSLRPTVDFLLHDWLRVQTLAAGDELGLQAVHQLGGAVAGERHLDVLDGAEPHAQLAGRAGRARDLDARAHHRQRADRDHEVTFAEGGAPVSVAGAARPTMPT